MFLAELWEILLSASLTDKGVPLNMIEAQLTELKNSEVGLMNNNDVHRLGLIYMHNDNFDISKFIRPVL